MSIAAKYARTARSEKIAHKNVSAEMGPNVRQKLGGVYVLQVFKLKF